MTEDAPNTTGSGVMNGAESLAADARCRRGRGVLRQPGHLGDALRVGGGPGRRDAAGAGAVRGRGDGDGRRLRGEMAERPAATLLHLGPGLANGLANLHNARRAASPIVNIVGDHATYHAADDAPLTVGHRRVRPSGVRAGHLSTSAGSVAADGARRRCRPPARRPGQIATLIVPADVAWLDAGPPADRLPVAPPSSVSAAAVAATCRGAAQRQADGDPGCVARRAAWWRVRPRRVASLPRPAPGCSAIRSLPPRAWRRAGGDRAAAVLRGTVGGNARAV